ncbi:MAG: SRPBCC family protein [Pseudomonadota bacterium]
MNPMKLLKVLLAAIGGIVALFIVVGFFLPSTSHVERSITINAPAADVFAYLDDFRKFNEWSPWAGLDPDTVYTFEGPATGIGSTMHWSSDDPNVGEGTQEIIESVPHSRLVTALDFGAQGQAIATFELDEQAGATRITWMLDNDFGYNLMFRYFGLMMETWVGTSYEEGLAKLKMVVEA